MVSGVGLSPNAGVSVRVPLLIHICVLLRSGAVGTSEPAV